MSGRPWWSSADEAEFALLIDELVTQAWPHRGKPRFAAALADAVEVVLAWRRRRELLSLACYLRARQDVEDARAS